MFKPGSLVRIASSPYFSSDAATGALGLVETPTPAVSIVRLTSGRAKTFWPFELVAFDGLAMGDLVTYADVDGLRRTAVFLNADRENNLAHVEVDPYQSPRNVAYSSLIPLPLPSDHPLASQEPVK